MPHIPSHYNIYIIFTLSILRKFSSKKHTSVNFFRNPILTLYNKFISGNCKTNICTRRFKVMYKKIQELYNFSDYQIAQLRFTFMTIFAELSKFLIFALIFRNQLPLYLWAVLILQLTRSTSGGLHFNTYISCFIASLIFLTLGISILPQINLSKFVQMILLLLCIVCSYLIGPVTSKKHIELTMHTKHKLKTQLFIRLFIYMLLLYVMPQNSYIDTGFWIIILNTLQHAVSCLQKGVEHEVKSL